MLHDPAGLDSLDFDKGAGLIPVIAQHAHTGEVLMLAMATREALERTLRERRMTYFSRSRSSLWLKGETSGNFQRLVSLHADCDRDCVLALVLPDGPSCHTGARTCFSAPPVLSALADVITRRLATPPTGGYTARLLSDENLRLKKLAEEALELALACRDGDAGRAAEEAADLIYHTLVACAVAGASLEDVLRVLDDRRRSAVPPRDQAVEPQQHDRPQDGDSE